MQPALSSEASHPIASDDLTTVPNRSTRLAAAVGSTFAGIVFAVLLGTSRSLTAPAALLIFAGGLAAWYLWFSLPVREDTTWRTDRCRGLTLWIFAGVGFGLVELTAFFGGDDHEHPTFSRIVNPLFSSPVTRGAAALGWLMWGRHLASLVPRKEPNEALRGTRR